MQTVSITQGQVHVFGRLKIGCLDNSCNSFRHLYNRDRAIELVGGVDSLRRRFLERNVTYLAGTKDVLPLAGMCEDDLFQGGCRLERAHRYFNSLALFGAGEKNAHHQSHQVAGSNHDHTFMFQLSVKEIFG